MAQARGTGRVYQRGEVWWLEYWERGTQYRESTGLRGSRSEAAAKRLLRAKIGTIAQGTFQAKSAVTVAQVLDDFEQDYRLRGKSQYAKLHSHLKPVYAALGHLKVQELTEREINAYITTRLQTVSSGTVNRETQPLGQALRLAHTRQVVHRVPTITVLQEHNVREGFFTYEEVVALVQHLPAYLQDFVWFAYYSGWRKGEITTLQWRDVDLHARVVKLRPEFSKTLAGRVLALEGPLWELLSRRQAVATWVFHHNGQPIGDFRKAWRTALRSAGLPPRLFHDLRRTAVRDMVRAGVPERIAMAISGHKTRAIFDRYTIVDETDLREAVRKTHTFRTSRTEPAHCPS